MNNYRSMSAFLTIASWAIVRVNCPLFNHSSLDRPNSVLLLGTDFPAWLVLVLESCCSYLFPDSHSVGSHECDPWWVYLHHGNWQVFHLGDVLFCFVFSLPVGELIYWHIVQSSSAHSLASLCLAQLAWWRGMDGRKGTDNKSSVTTSPQTLIT